MSGGATDVFGCPGPGRSKIGPACPRSRYHLVGTSAVLGITRRYPCCWVFWVNTSVVRGIKGAKPVLCGV